ATEHSKHFYRINLHLGMGFWLHRCLLRDPPRRTWRSGGRSTESRTGGIRMLMTTTLALAVSLVQAPAAGDLSVRPADAMPQDTIVVALEAASGSGLSGSAQLGTTAEGGAEVTIEV